MTTYRLPEAFGGGEMEEHRKVSGGTEAPTGTVAFLLDGCLVCVAKALLTEVKPPLPAEPAVGSFVHLASYYGVYERVDRGWLNAGDAAGNALEWDTLIRLNSGDAPVRLVPDPFAEPVEVPWEHEDREGYVMGVYEPTRPWSAARVGRDDYCADLTPGACRDMARALWRAQAERAS